MRRPETGKTTMIDNGSFKCGADVTENFFDRPADGDVVWLAYFSG